MQKLKVSSLPLQEVISDIANEFETNYSQNCGIYQVCIPEHFGKGTITGADFDDGLGLIRYDCLFKEDIVFEYSIDRIHPVKFLFAMEGEISHKFMNESLWHQIPRHKSAVVASSEHHGHSIQFIGGERTEFNSLELERRKFQGKISCETRTIAKSWREMLNDVTAKKTFYHDGFYSLKLSEIFSQWDNYHENNFLKKLNLEGMAYNILVLQIEQFQDDLKAEGNKTLLRKSEMKQLFNAVKIVEDRLGDLPAIGEIASEVGLNANKLQQGFKELFGKTVNHYIREKRLETARTLLLNTDHTLYSITSIVGYKSQSYLSKEFKAMYGVLPSDFKRKHEKKNEFSDELKKMTFPQNT